MQEVNLQSFWNSISFSFYSIGLFSFLFYFIWYSFFGYELCQFSSKWNVGIYIVRSFYCDLRNILTPYCGEATTKRRRLQPRCWCYSLRHKILISKAVLKENCSEIHAIVKNESGQSSLKGVLKPSSPLHLLWAESYESVHLKLFIRLLAFKSNTLKWGKEATTLPQFVISIIHVNMSYRDILKLFMREWNHISTQCVISILKLS